MPSPTILITGASGQLAKAIAAEFTAAHIHYVAKNRVELDITNHAQLDAVLTELKPNIIVNCAAYTQVDKAETEPALCSGVNEHAVKSLAAYCFKSNSLLVHFSTDYVFDGLSASPYQEQDLPNPLNHYGKSKLAGEQAIQQYGCQHYIIRTSWLYSPTGKNFYTTMQQLALDNKAVKVVNDQIGAPTKATDLAAAVALIIKQYGTKHALAQGLYHYCGERYLSWYEFALQIFNAQQSRTPLIPISSQEYTALATRPADSRLNCQRLKHWLATHTGQTALRYR